MMRTFCVPAVALPVLGDLDLHGFILFVFFCCFLGVLVFEFVNGFHDTANAVATVIYTKTLKPVVAIIWSGLWNFLGVFVIGTAVAMSLLKLVPLDKLITLPVTVGACLVLSILIASIIWNVSTWYLGIPLSSSHTLIGALIGAGLGFAHFYSGGVNWSKAGEIGLSLLISPIIGFAGSAILLYLEKKFIRAKIWFHTPENDEDFPPLPIRAILVTTCTLVSFFHGSNDGQKGVGLMMLVLIAFMPARFALNDGVFDVKIAAIIRSAEQNINQIRPHNSAEKAAIIKLEVLLAESEKQVAKRSIGTLNQKYGFRKQLQKTSASLKTFLDDKNSGLSDDERKSLKKDEKTLSNITDYAPIWVLAAISLALGFGTMVGWKRIVVTVGEKIGRETLNYAEGATAEVVAAATIGLSTGFGLPVSTTHVLSSGVAGAMLSSNGVKNLNFGTIKQIGIAWLLTLPAAIGLAYVFFIFFHLFV